MDIKTKSTLTTNDIQAANHTLRKVENFVFLGVIFASNLKWNLQVQHIIKKASKRIFIIRNLRRAGCSVDVMITSYIAFIRSILTYAFPSYCNLSKYLLKSLIRVEKRIFRIISADSPADDLDNALTRTGERLFSTISANEDHLLRHLFSEVNTRTRSSSGLYAPFAKTVRFKDSFIKFCK